MLHKAILIICDGLSDRPIFELGNKTPLEAAQTPNLDKMIQRGSTGLMHTVDIGVRPGSDVAHLSLFGYNINKYYTGRGPFEAAGYGIDLEPGDIAFRGNFSTLDKDGIIIDRRAGRIEDTSPLVKSLTQIKLPGIQLIIKQGVGHRTAVVFRGKGLSGNITDSDPHVTNKKVLTVKSINNKPSEKKTAKLVNDFINKAIAVLKKHPYNLQRVKQGLPAANVLLLRGAGTVPILPSFESKYGLKAACIAGAGLYKGIAKQLGMDIIKVNGATGKADSNIKAKIDMAIKLLDKYDFIFVHIKGTDILAEDGNYQGKKEFIEKIDKALTPLVKRDDVLVVLTADHTTSSYLKIHTADPVPVLVAGKGLNTDNAESFGERSAVSGRLGHIQGKHLMLIILDLLGRAPLTGA